MVTERALGPEDVLAFARERGVAVELVAPGVPMPTVPLAAAAIGVRPEQILKTLLFEDGDGGYVVAIACGTARVDRGRLAAAVGRARLRLAGAETVLAVTGYPAGGVPPLGHRQPVPTVIDARAAALEVAYGGGGVDDLLLRLRPDDLRRLTGATVAEIVA